MKKYILLITFMFITILITNYNLNVYATDYYEPGEYWQSTNGLFTIDKANIAAGKYFGAKLSSVLQEGGNLLEPQVHKDISDFGLKKLNGYGIDDCLYCVYQQGSYTKITLCRDPKNGEQVYLAPTGLHTNVLRFCYKIDGEFVPLPSVDIPVYGYGYYSSNISWYYFYLLNNQTSSPSYAPNAFADEVAILDSNLPVYLLDKDEIDNEGYWDDFVSGTPIYTPENEENYVVDLEVPQNLTMTGNWICKDTLFTTEHGNLKFKWTQNDANYDKWTTQIQYYMKSEYCQNGFTHIFDKWIPSDTFLFQKQFDVLCSKREFTKDFYCLDTSAYTLSEGSRLLGGISVDDFSVHGIGALFKIRNYYDDGKKIHISNWIELKVNTNGDIFTGLGDEDPTYTIEEHVPTDDELKGGSSINEDGSNKTGGINSDSTYNPNDVFDPTASTDSESLKEQIINGFGLVGNNGLVQLFSDFFDYVPKWFFSLIATGISLVIIVALVKLAL